MLSRWVLTPVVILWVFWSVPALYFTLPFSSLINSAVIAVWLPGVLLLLLLPKLKFRYPAILISLLLPLVIWSARQPGTIEHWRPEQSRLPWGGISPDSVVLHDLRAFRYSGDGEIVQQNWYDCTVCPDSLIGVDFFLIRFADWDGIAHALISFRFSDGDAIALSVEARRRKDEAYALLPGMFRRFDLMYVLGDERDILGLRLCHQRDPVYRLPIHTPPEKVRQLFINVIQTASRLREQPQFYHTLLRTCTTELAMQANRLRQDHISMWDYRLLFPGFAGELLQEAGLLQMDLPLNGNLESFRVKPDTLCGLTDPRQFSKALRGFALPSSW